MESPFLDDATIRSLQVDDFLAKTPFPWHRFEGLLTESGFARLMEEFPDVALFEWHSGRRGQHYVKPQDRYFLSYERDATHEPGTIGPDDLPPAWATFIDELEQSALYQGVIGQIIDQPIQRVRYTWHMGVEGSEVCPHIDQDYKMATHIFYFNTADDWDPAWGGAPVILSGKRSEVEFPDFPDFPDQEPVEVLGNRSFLFRNTTEAWHGVRPLTCPDGYRRRLFNVVFENLGRRLDIVHTQRRGGVREKLAKVIGR